MNPLEPFSKHLLRIRRASSTPVLVTPGYLALRPIFLSELVQSLSSHTAEEIRIDWLQTGSAWGWGFGIWTSQFAKRVNRVLHRAHRGGANRARLEVTSAIGKPQGGETLVIGVCTESSDSGPWTTRIRLGGSRIAVGDLY